MKLPFGTISITNESKKLIGKIIDSGKLSQGKYVYEFERLFAGLLGTKEAVAVSSGTDADTLALAVLYDLGAKRGDEIIVPALSFIATGNAVLHAGFKPVFVDVRKETLNIDVDKIEGKINHKTKAIMPVHLMGKPAQMDRIKAIAKKHKLLVIEDAAEAYGGKYKGINLGTIGDIGAFSLYIAHIITTIEGGILVTNNERYAEIIRSLRVHGRACKCKICTLSSLSKYCQKRFNYQGIGDIRFFFERTGYSAKMNELEAAVGLGSLARYNEILSRRRNNLLYLIEKFKEFQEYFYVLHEEDKEIIGPHAFSLLLRENVKFSRDELVSYLEKNGIETRSLFLSMPTQCPGFKFLRYKTGDFPNAEYIGDNGLHIGIHQNLRRDQLSFFINIIKKFLYAFAA